MTDKLIKLTSNFAITEKAEDDTLVISGWANTTDKDRAGDVILEEAWTKGGISDYLSNPIILGYHKHDTPIGKMVNHTVSSKGLFITAEISKAAGNTYQLIKEGILKSFSVGFKVKDADYDSTTDIFVIKDLELLEVSVVSVPANQHSIFNVSKQFESMEDSIDFKTGFSLEEKTDTINKAVEADTDKDIIVSKAEDAKTLEIETSEIQMTPEEITAAIAKGVAEETAKAAKAAEEKAIKVAEEKAAKEATAKAVEVGASGAEKLVAELTARLDNSEKSLGESLDGLRTELKEKNDEIVAMQNSKMQFSDKTSKEVAREDTDRAVFLAKILGKSVEATKFAGSIIEKASYGDHLASMTEDWEQQFSTNILNDIRRDLIIEPMFQTIAMQTNKMHIPINPEAAYGEWIATTAYKDAATSTGTAQEHLITDTTLSAHKLASKEYIGYEEEEDSILAVLPIIRDAVVRRMAKSSDLALLRGTGVGAADPIKGIAQLAKDAGGDYVTTLSIGGADKATASVLQTVRRGLGVRGLMPSDVVYIVSTEAYYDLLEDPDFRTVDKVGSNATILTGQVGSINGSPVVVSGEFDVVAIGNAAAIAVNTSNFIKGELRGLMVERDKNVEFQRNVIIASRRLGFIPIIDGVGVSVLEYVV